MSNHANVNIGNSGEYFVALNELDAPEYHIVPSKIVAETIATEYKKWLDTPGKNGQPHNENNMRNFYDKDDIYLNRWDFLDGAMLKTLI